LLILGFLDLLIAYEITSAANPKIPQSQNQQSSVIPGSAINK